GLRGCFRVRDPSGGGGQASCGRLGCLPCENAVDRIARRPPAPHRRATVGLLPLDSRQIRIAKLLMEQTGTSRLEQVASSLRLTDRVVRYNLPSVEAYLAGHGLELVKRRGVGIWIEGDAAQRSNVVDDLATSA